MFAKGPIVSLLWQVNQHVTHPAVVCWFSLSSMLAALAGIIMFYTKPENWEASAHMAFPYERPLPCDSLQPISFPGLSSPSFLQWGQLITISNVQSPRSSTILEPVFGGELHPLHPQDEES